MQKWQNNFQSSGTILHSHQQGMRILSLHILFNNCHCIYVYVWVFYHNHSCCVSLARTSSTILNRSGMSGHCFIPDLKRNFIPERRRKFIPERKHCLSLVSMMLADGFFIDVLYQIEAVTFIPNLLKVYLKNKSMSDLIQCLFCIYWDGSYGFDFLVC